jgi:hypothetical protein
MVYYLECEPTHGLYNYHVGLVSRHYLYDNGMSPALPIALLRVKVANLLSNNQFFVMKGPLLFFVLVRRYIPLSRLFGLLIPSPQCRIDGYYTSVRVVLMMFG